MNYIATSGHIGFHQYGEIEKICKKLFDTTGITYFCYQRLYRDQHLTFLPTSPELGKYLLTPEIYQNCWLAGMSFNTLKSGYLLWSVAKECITVSQRAIYEHIANELELGHGIDILEKFDAYCDVYCFASSSPRIYHCDLAYLKQFIFYFKQESRLYIQGAWREKIYLPPIYLQQTLPILAQAADGKQAGQDDFKIQKYYLHGGDPDRYLTHQEVECLKFLERGNTAKEVARILKISNRTVEKHVENLKAKLECSHLVEAIYIAKTYNVIE